ncbi:MAG: heparinase II/III family protein [Oscillospiraceae bacterium]|nr:heparinase II/III family protein [Oscillospiraceae bacterium]
MAENEEYIFFESFEEPWTKTPAGWIAWNAGQTVLHVEGGTHGSYAIQMIDDSETLGTGVRSKNIPVEFGIFYDVEVDGRIISGEGQYYVEFWDASNTRISVVIVNLSSTEWDTYKSTVSSPEDAQSITILLYQHATNVGVVEYDNIRVKEVLPEIRDYSIQVTDHPRLYFTKDEQQAFVARSNKTDKIYNGSSMSNISGNVTSVADAYVNETEFKLGYYGGMVITFEVPTPMPGDFGSPPGFEGPYPYWTSLSRQIQERMQTLSAAYILTGDTKYSDKAIEWALNLCTWESWTDPYYPAGLTCLDTAHFTYGVCTVYDMLYDLLTEAQRVTIEETLEKKSMSRLYKDVLSFSSDNGQILRASALATAVCAVFEKNDKAALYMTHVYDYFNWVLDALAYSGNNEGLMYTSYAVEYMMVAIDHIARATGDTSLIEHPYLTEILPNWIVIGGDNKNGRTANISDGSVVPEFFITASLMNKLTGNGLYGYYLNRGKISSAGLNGLLYMCDELIITHPGDDLLTKYLKEVGWGSMRTGWEPDDPVLVFISSKSRMGHNHFDQNSFVIMMNDYVFIDDPGYQDFGVNPLSAFTKTTGHSTLYVNGQGQTSFGTGSITDVFTIPSFGYMIGNAPTAYSADLEITKFDRHFIMVNREHPYYIVMDDMRSNLEHEYTWRADVETVPNVKIDTNYFSLTQGRSTLGVSFAASKTLEINHYTYPGTTRKVVDVTGINGGAADYFAVISPVDVRVKESLPNGAIIEYGDGINDIALFGTINSNNVTSDGSAAFIFGISNETFGGYSAVGAKTLSYNGIPLFESETNINVFADFVTGVTIECTRDTTAKIYLPDKVMELSLKAGTNKIEIPEINEPPPPRNNNNLWKIIGAIIIPIITLVMFALVGIKKMKPKSK